MTKHRSPLASACRVAILDRLRVDLAEASPRLTAAWIRDRPSALSRHQAVLTHKAGSPRNMISREVELTMTPCFAFLCSDPALLDIAISPFRDALQVPDGAPSGWGVAYYQAGQPLLRKQPRAAAPPFDIVDAVQDLKTPLLLGQIREAWDVPKRNENTPPFRFRRWTFTLSGAPPHMDTVRDEINGAIPEFIQRNIRGRTHAEIIFHLLLAFLNDAGKLDDPRTDRAPIARALTSALAYVDRLVGDTWPYCCAITNGQILAATERDHPMHIKKSPPYIHVGVGPDDKPLSYPHLHALAILGSTPPEGDAWERVDGGTVLTTNLDLDITLSSPTS